MEINGKAVVYVVLILLVLFLLLTSFGIVNLKSDKSLVNYIGDSEIPEKCKLPSGQDIDSWKEHLSHHSETRDCLKYFN